MTIGDVWMKAFLASLGRVPIARAREDGDQAVRLCVARLHANGVNWAPDIAPLEFDGDEGPPSDKKADTLKGL